MLYICTKQDIIKNYWEKEFGKKYSVKVVEIDFFYFEQDFTNQDILILDIDQFETIESVIEYYSSLPKILKSIAILDEPKLAHGTYLIKQGFKSYIGKKTSKLIVDKALATVIEGNIWLYPELMNYIIKHISTSGDKSNASTIMSKLSSKEQNVANLVADGLSNKDIATTLGIQIVTVKKHISSIFTKLNIKDRVSLAVLINS